MKSVTRVCINTAYLDTETNENVLNTVSDDEVIASSAPLLDDNLIECTYPNIDKQENESHCNLHTSNPITTKKIK